MAYTVMIEDETQATGWSDRFEGSEHNQFENRLAAETAAEAAREDSFDPLNKADPAAMDGIMAISEAKGIEARKLFTSLWQRIRKSKLKRAPNTGIM